MLSQNGGNNSWTPVSIGTTLIRTHVVINHFEVSLFWGPLNRANDSLGGIQVDL